MREEANCNCDCGDPKDRRTYALVWQAERARAELLREKIKQAYERRRGPVLDQVADALAEYMERTARRANEDDQAWTALEERLKQALEARVQ